MTMRIVTIVIVVILVSAGVLYAADTVRVITRENAIRLESNFISPVKVKVRYNDPLTVRTVKGDWLLVTFKGTSGWIHKSAVTARTASLSGSYGSRGKGASADEVALAGKGFNPQVEASYKNRHPGLQFQTVDTIEHFQVPPENLQDFMRKGGLRTP
jgi:hypothetical protein